MDDIGSYRDYVGQTVLNPLGLIAILVLGLAMLIVPRRYAVWPMIIMGCFVASAQRIVIFTLNFDLLRVMVIFGTVRMLARGEWKGLKWRGIDSVMVAYAVVGSIVYDVQYGSIEALKNSLGIMYELVGMYFLFRCLVRNMEDVAHVALGFALASVPVVLAFLLEWMTGRNVFSVFGGVPEITGVRGGRLRCQGAYSHPIMAGCYWASLLPLMASLWWRKGMERRWGIIGVCSGLAIVVLCASSTPVSAVAFGVLGAGFFIFRSCMGVVRWLIIGSLLVLHLAMKGPVWSLVGRFDLVGGSTGWHRANLINQFILRVNEWWLFGVKEVESWGVSQGDITNQYVLVGVRGGIWAVVLLVALIVMAFSGVGRLWRLELQNRANLVMSWALGISLFVHCISFIGVSYFGQIVMLWYLTLGMIASVSPMPIRAPSVVPVAGSGGSMLPDAS